MIELGESIIHTAEDFLVRVKREHQENEQWFINWQNRLNDISVKDMNEVIV